MTGLRSRCGSTAEEIWAKIRDDDPSLQEEEVRINIQRYSQPDEHTIADSDIWQLGQDIGRNTHLARLVISAAGGSNLSTLQALNEGISQNRSIKDIVLESQSPSFFWSLRVFLMNNDKLERLHCAGCHFTARSARVLGFALAARPVPLKEISLVDSTFHSSSLDDFRTSFGIHQVLLLGPHCGMSTVQIPFMKVVNDSLSLDIFRSMSLDVCDVSSINSTYSSDHSLETIIVFGSGRRGYRMPGRSQNQAQLHQLLKLNQNPDKKMVARQKVVKYHFNENFRMDPFVEMGSCLLLRVIDFIDGIASRVGRHASAVMKMSGSNRLSILFQLLKGDPNLMTRNDESSKIDVIRNMNNKRKRLV